MCKAKTFKPLSELTLLDRFLFDTVMQDPENARAIRLDLLSVSENDTIYDAEAQQQNKGSQNLRRRSRYYQGVLDASLLIPGETDFKKLQDVYIIFIAPFDIFGKGKYCYTFRMKCEEVPELPLDDGATRLFLNTRGSNDHEVTAELIEFLHMAEKTLIDDDHETHSTRIRELIEKIKMIKADQEVGARYMRYQEEKALERKEAFAEGLTEGRDSQLSDDIKGMLAEGLDAAVISRITKKTPEEIDELITRISAE